MKNTHTSSKVKLKPSWCEKSKDRFKRKWQIPSCMALPCASWNGKRSNHKSIVTKRCIKIKLEARATFQKCTKAYHTKTFKNRNQSKFMYIKRKHVLTKKTSEKYNNSKNINQNIEKKTLKKSKRYPFKGSAKTMNTQNTNLKKNEPSPFT